MQWVSVISKVTYVHTLTLLAGDQGVDHWRDPITTYSFSRQLVEWRQTAWVSMHPFFRVAGRWQMIEPADKDACSVQAHAMRFRLANESHSRLSLPHHKWNRRCDISRQPCT